MVSSMGATVYALLLLVLPAPAYAETKADPTRAAIEKGLGRIEKGAASYITKRNCFSCHHQAMALLTLSSARQHGFAVDPGKIRQQVDFTLKTFLSKKDRVLKGQGVEGASTMAVYALFGLE